MAFAKLSKQALARRVDDPGQEMRMDGLATTASRLPTKADYIAEMSRLWHEAQTRFLAIGHYLVYAKETLAHGEYEAMIASELPFKTGVALQLKTVAEAVMAERLRASELPQSYSTAYLLASLPDEKLDIARKRDLVRPDVKRREIEDLRSELRAPGNERRRQLEAEQRRLTRKRDIVQRRLDEIARELGTAAGVIEGSASQVD